MSFDDARATPDPRTLHREWVTGAELRRHLGISANTMTKWLKQGMPAHRAVSGGRYRFDLAEVDRWIELDSPWSARAAGSEAS